jgi:hypothetical protein
VDGTPYEMRACTALLLLVATTQVARAQPLDPYSPLPAPKGPAPKQLPAPAPTPAPNRAPDPAPVAPTDPGAVRASEDPVLAEQVAQSLVLRAQELFDARVFVDAKQLAVEALIRSPKGPSAEQAKFLIAAVNKQLGIVDEPAKPPPRPSDPVDMTPLKDPTAPADPIPAQPEAPGDGVRTAASVHSALFGGLIGATIGSFISSDSPARGAVPVGLGAGVLAGLYLPRALDRLHWNEAQIRTMGAGSVWGGVIGGLFADTVKTSGTSPREVMVGASLVSTAGALAGAALASKNSYTSGDIALVDTFAGMGTLGGFTIGMLMQPAESEAYSLNAILGAAGGIVVGLIAAPETNTTPRRMLRVAGAAAIGGGTPFLLYAAIRDSSTKADERVTGLLSSVGLVAGAWIGFRLTRDMDLGLDILGGKTKDGDDAPPAVIGRSSAGHWGLGALTIQPLSTKLSSQPGMAVPILAGRF